MKTVNGAIYLPAAIMATPGGNEFAKWLDTVGRAEWANLLRDGVSVTVRNVSNKNWERVRDAILSAGAWPIPKRVNGKIVEDDSKPYFKYSATVPE